MPDHEAKITGVVLAGVRARRMGGCDKGLIPFAGQPLIKFAISSLLSITDQIVINANRNLANYGEFGYPVISDDTDTFDGPLAGMLSVMSRCKTRYMLTVPCDCPMMGEKSLARMVKSLKAGQADCYVAYDGKRLHPVFLLIDCRLAESLETYLKSGKRKIDSWLNQHNVVLVDYRDSPEVFLNINTPEELRLLEKQCVEKTVP